MDTLNASSDRAPYTSKNGNECKVAAECETDSETGWELLRHPHENDGHVECHTSYRYVDEQCVVI